MIMQRMRALSEPGSLPNLNLCVIFRRNEKDLSALLLNFPHLLTRQRPDQGHVRPCARSRDTRRGIRQQERDRSRIGAREDRRRGGPFLSASLCPQSSWVDGHAQGSL